MFYVTWSSLLQLASIPGIDDIKQPPATSAQESAPEQDSVPSQTTENPPESSDEPIQAEAPDPNVVKVKNDVRLV